MSQELNVTIYEPSKNPRSISRDIDPEFIPLIERGVYFNEDGSLCDDFEEYPEDVFADEFIGFNMDLLPPAAIQSAESLPSVSQRQEKLQKQIDHLVTRKKKIYMKNKLQKLRKKLKSIQQREMNDKVVAPPQNPNPSSNQENRTNPIFNENTPRPRKEFRQLNKPANSKPYRNGNLNANRKPPGFIRKNKKKAPLKSPANTANSSQPPNPSRFPTFIRNPWMRKNTPKNASRNNPSANSSDYIPIGNRNSVPRFRYNGRIPPLTNSSRYFSLDNC